MYTTEITAICACFLTKSERPTKYFWGGFVLAIAGIAMINVGGTQIDVAHIKGDLLALLAAAVWGIYCVVLNEYVGENVPVIQRIYLSDSGNYDYLFSNYFR